MRIAINHFIGRDKSLLYDEDYDIDEDEIEIIISKFEYYLQGLSNKEKFVFDFYSILANNDRLEVLPVALRDVNITLTRMLCFMMVRNIYTLMEALISQKWPY